MALNKLVKFVFGVNLFEAGKKIIESLWQGIKSAASNFSALGPLLKLLVVGVKGFAAVFIGAIRAVAAAMISNPILLAITLIATAVYLIIRNWSYLKEFFKSLWSGIVSTLSAAWNWIRTNWQRLLQVFLWTNPLTAPIMALNKLVKFVFGVNLFEAGKKIIESLWQGIKSAASKPVEAVKDIVSKVRNLLPFSPAKEGPLRDIHRIRLIETIAGAVKPEPLISSMTAVAKKVASFEPLRTAIQPLMQPVRQAFEPRAISPAGKNTQPRKSPIPTFEPRAISPAGINSITINFGDIKISGVDGAKGIATDLEKEIRAVLDRISKDYFRRQY